MAISTTLAMSSSLIPPRSRALAWPCFGFGLWLALGFGLWHALSFGLVLQSSRGSRLFKRLIINFLCRIHPLGPAVGWGTERVEVKVFIDNQLVTFFCPARWLQNACEIGVFSFRAMVANRLRDRCSSSQPFSNERPLGVFLVRAWEPLLRLLRAWTGENPLQPCSDNHLDHSRRTHLTIIAVILDS